MKEILTLPDSLKTQIQQAQNLLAQSDQANQQGNQSLALSRAEQGLNALVEIAQRNPELAVVLLAAMHGYNGIEFKTVEKSTVYERVERKLFGICMGTDVVPVTNTRVVTRTIRFTK